MKKVLLVYASAGAGHQKAAEALYQYLKDNHPEFELKIIDLLDYTPDLFRLLYSRGYIFLISKLPWLWYLLYRASSFSANNKIFAYLDYLTASPFVDLLVRERPDVVISTHFFTSSILTVFKKKNPAQVMRQSMGKFIVCHSRESGNPDDLDSPVKPGNDKMSPLTDRLLAREIKLVSIITDYNLHPLWIGGGVDLYIAACDFVRQELSRRNVPPDKIRVCGIPAKEKFYRQEDRKRIAAKYGIKDSLFTVLVITGAVGLGPIKEIVRALAGEEVRLLVVCGNNKRLYQRLSVVAGQAVGTEQCSVPTEALKPFPLIDYVDELMSVSDAVVTKAGGLTITESLAKGLPMVFFSNIPGLESANARVLAENGCAFDTTNIEEIKQRVLSLKNNPALYQETVSNITRFRKSQTLMAISTEVKNLLTCCGEM